MRKGVTIVTLDHLIDCWRGLNSAERRPWVLFEHGTCVTIPDPGDDLIAQAAGLIAGLADAPPGNPARHVVTPCDDRGWLVATGHESIRTYVENVALAAGAGGGDQDAVAVAMWGQSFCGRDARELGAVYVEDSRAERDEASIGRAETWAHLVRKAQQAEREGSDWERFGLPVAAVQLLDEADEDQPPPSLDELDLSLDVRETSEVLEEMIRDAPHQQQPFTLFAGLRPGQHVDAEVLRAPLLARRFPRGRVVALTGFVCAAGRTEPPLYAAKAHGAILAIRVNRASPLTKPGDGPDEYEFLLPRDCRCRVIDVLEEGLFPDGSGAGGRSKRVTVRLEQLQP
ncbi:hypothetical protein KJ554_12315 [bacterium]|nr:hypothetical protein [bacterium]